MAGVKYLEAGVKNTSIFPIFVETEIHISLEDLKHIGKNIRSIRLLRGLKQKTIAKKLGISQQNVSKMENQKKVSPEKLKAAAEVLGITVEAIEQFNEKAVLNNNIALEKGTGQTNHIHPIKEVIQYFKE